jgi:hypothetical protein
MSLHCLYVGTLKDAFNNASRIFVTHCFKKISDYLYF